MIHIERLAKRYGSVQAVDQVTLTLETPEILVMLGPSGCGKTTLLRLLAGFERPDSGWIEIAGQVVSSPQTLTAPNRRRLGMIFQDLALWPHLTVVGNVAFGLQGRGITRQAVVERVEAVLQQVALTNHRQRFPQQLSGGERQRLAIARALVTRPAYLLMDEPFSSLDPVLKRELIHLLLTLKASLHTGIIYVTHNLDEPLSLADRIAVMQQGKRRSIIEKPLFASFTQGDLLTWYTEAL